jgi:hypothetical protein
MGISITERETVINFGRNDDLAIVWTSDTMWFTKMDKLIEKNPEEFKCTKEETIDGQVVQKRYEFPKKYVSIRSKSVKRELTEEQKQKYAERAKKMVEARKRKAQNKSDSM